MSFCQNVKVYPIKIHYCKVECVCMCFFFSQFCDVAQVVINRKMISQIWLKIEYDSVKKFKAVFCIIGYQLSITYWNLIVASGDAYF
jgi:hypothetical protein